MILVIESGFSQRARNRKRNLIQAHYDRDLQQGHRNCYLSLVKKSRSLLPDARPPIRKTLTDPITPDRKPHSETPQEFRAFLYTSNPAKLAKRERLPRFLSTKRPSRDYPPNPYPRYPIFKKRISSLHASDISYHHSFIHEDPSLIPQSSSDDLSQSTHIWMRHILRILFSTTTCEIGVLSIRKFIVRSTETDTAIIVSVINHLVNILVHSI